MADLSITDSQGNPVDISKIQWSSPSSLFDDLKSELLHLAVAPDFIKVKDQPLTKAAPKPQTYQLSVQHDFQLGKTAAEIDVTPGAKVTLGVNTSAGSDLFDDDAFHLPTAVPPQVGFVGLSVEGSLDLGFCGTSGDLTFGIDRNSGITLEFWKAFATGTNEPTLWSATSAMFSSFVIPASVEDLKRVSLNDVCCVSGQGCLTISGGVSVSVGVNPLASVNLPVGAGTVAVQSGVLAGLSAALTLSGSYQIRVQRLTADTLRLSFLREKGATLTTDLSLSAGVSVEHGKTDLLAKLLGTIGKGTVDPTGLAALTPDELQTFTAALKQGLDHSLRASVDFALSQSIDNSIAFQYDIQTSQLDGASIQAINRALKGDLSLLTSLEENVRPDGMIASGVKLLNSVFATAKAKGFSFKLNLLGIVNLISSTNLINQCEFLFEPASGDLTIKETAQSDRIDAITDPFKRQQALCKALFDSVLVTTTYVVGKVATLPTLSCEAAHFAANQNTNRQNIGDYVSWFAALDLMNPSDLNATLINARNGGASKCVVRVPFNDVSCDAMFFDRQGNLHNRAHYLEIARQSMKALLHPTSNVIDQCRYSVLNDDVTWQKALAIGPSPQLSTLIPASINVNPALALNVVSGDIYDITWWADSMQKAGTALNDMRGFLAGRDPLTLASNPDFTRRREALQKLMLKVVASSKVRFQEPWGLLCLYKAAGSHRAAGTITTPGLIVQKDMPLETATAVG